MDHVYKLITVYRYHAFFTNSPFDSVTADVQHRDRAGAIEHVFADLQAGAQAHFPSADFQANAAWLTLAAPAHNLLRALGRLAGGPHARPHPTLRRRFITVAARRTRSARRITLHLPQNWTWDTGWQHIFTTTHRTHALPTPP